MPAGQFETVDFELPDNVPAAELQLRSIAGRRPAISSCQIEPLVVGQRKEAGSAEGCGRRSAVRILGQTCQFCYGPHEEEAGQRIGGRLLATGWELVCRLSSAVVFCGEWSLVSPSAILGATEPNEVDEPSA